MLNLRSQREIEQMRPAGRLVAQALTMAQEMVKPGAIPREIDQKIAEFYREQQATPLFLDYPNPAPGKAAFPGVTCMSVNEEVVHGIPGDRPLEIGDVLSVDTGCRIGGWCGDSAVTLPVGEIDPQIKQLLDVTQSVLNLAIEQMAVCRWWSEVAAQMAKLVKEAGFSVVECFVGHGIGHEMHEEPQVPNFVSSQLKRQGDFRLDPGLVLAIEPMVNIGTKEVIAMDDDWTQSTADGSASAHFEHTVAITEDGPVILTARETRPAATV